MVKTSREVVDEVMRNAEARAADPKEMWGIAPFGFPSLDVLTGGIQHKKKIVLGARPKVGKSAFTGGIILNVARYFRDHVNKGLPESDWLWVKVITLEMKAAAWAERQAAGMAGVSTQKIRSGYTRPEQLEDFKKAGLELRGLPIAYYDDEAINFEQARKFLRDPHQMTGLWILDHIGLFREVSHGAANNNATGAFQSAANFVMRECHETATGIIIAHMNRESERSSDKRPTLSTFAGTDQIGRNADLALALHRPWLYADIPPEQLSDPQPAELLVLAHRDGPSGVINLIYTPRSNSFVELPGMNEHILHEDRGAP
jgi:replicative DNA helicase